MLPKTLEELERIRKECRKMIVKRAIVGGVASLIPVPGTNVAVDVALVIQLINSLNKRFGLTEQDLDSYDTWTRLLLYDLIKRWGAKFAGRVVTREVILQVIKRMSLRITVVQCMKCMPVIGQSASAALSVTAITVVGTTHVHECYRIVKRVIIEKNGGPKNPLLKFLILFLPFRVPWL